MLFGTSMIVNNELNIGGVSVSNLVKKHGSPLYVYDQNHIEKMIDIFKENFSSSMFNARVAYASKAFLTKAMIQLLTKKNMSLDCVSGGEIYTAVNAGFDMSKTVIHGNNKSVSELEMCINENVGLVVVDNIGELETLINLAKDQNKQINTILRVNPGIEAHTHEYIITAKLTSKFGESIFDEEVLGQVINKYNESANVHLKGFHCHIGSQVFGKDPFIETVEVMTSFIQKIEETYHIKTPVLNIGGGFGVYHTDRDDPVSIPVLLQDIISKTESCIKEKNISLEELIIEPGRSIISNAGTTLYKIGYKKETFGGKNYLFVNGGMTDNIRPALYQAEYSCDIATNMSAPKSGKWTVAGKLCESGDLLIRETSLQDFTNKDILAIYTTGAYNYTMASNYNRMLKPAVVFVKDGVSKEVVKREHGQ